MTEQAPTLHAFERAGLGRAPFLFVGVSEKTYQACPGAPIQGAGTCDYCGIGIRYCYHIKSHDGKQFVVGCDCVRRTTASNNRLLADVERAVAKLRQEQRDAKRAEQQKKREEAFRLELESQRERNGGLTDREVADNARQAAERERNAATRQANDWLVTALHNAPQTPFVESIIEDLGHKPIETGFSPRCKAILAGIFAKADSGKSRGKDYEASITKFWDKAGREE